MKLTKILALILAAMLCISVFAACGGDKPEDEKKDDEKDNPSTGSTIAVTIVDNEGKTIYENKTLDIDPAQDGTEDGKLFLENVLAVCNYYDETLEYEFDAEGELTINGLTSIKGTVTEKVEIESAEDSADDAAETETPAEGEDGEKKEDEEKEPVYIDVEYCLFWTIEINGEEKSLDEEIKLGDNVKLIFNKIPADELLNE